MNDTKGQRIKNTAEGHGGAIINDELTFGTGTSFIIDPKVLVLPPLNLELELEVEGVTDPLHDGRSLVQGRHDTRTIHRTTRLHHQRTRD